MTKVVWLLLNRDVLTAAEQSQIQQIFTIENSLISLYEIGETETIQEMIQKTRTPNE
jgi:hypothetical protein